MPGGRARGNPVQIFFENLQKFPSTDLKNILYFDIPMYPSFICHIKFGLSPHGLDFGVFGPLWIEKRASYQILSFETFYDIYTVVRRTLLSSRSFPCSASCFRHQPTIKIGLFSDGLICRSKEHVFVRNQATVLLFLISASVNLMQDFSSSEKT